MPVVVLASWYDAGSRRRGDVGEGASSRWLLLLEAMMIGVFAATDVFLFYVFFEAMLVPMYFLIGSFGGPRRQYAAVKFFLYSPARRAGHARRGHRALLRQRGQRARARSPSTRWSARRSTPAPQKWLFLGFFIAFAIKAPLVPFHTWLPDAGAEAPAGGAVLLVGVLDKVGTFGFLRYCLPLFPDASRVLRAAGARAVGRRHPLRARCWRWARSDMKRLVAYTSVSHFGFIALGIFAFTTAGRHRRRALHGQPRPLHRRALPRRRHADRPAADRG